MKKIIFSLAIALPFCTQAQHKLEQIWQTDTIVAIPESILPDFKKGILYVSLIDGGGWVVDGKGGVGKLSVDGKKYDSTWITGLNAPKGLGRVGDKLYVADVTEVVVIDMNKGKVEKKIAIADAKNLNDITTDDKGVVYISDSKTGKIHTLTNDVPAVYMEGMNGVNGLKAVGTDLYILAKKAVLKADAQKNVTQLTTLEHGGDGIEPVGNGDFIVTEWAGYIYYVYADGKKELMLDTHEQKINSADIGYDQAKKILYVPTFNGKKVVAYKVK